MIAWRPLAILISSVLFLAVLVVGSGMMTGLDGLREMWREIRVYVIAGAVVTLLALVTVVGMVVHRLRARKQRDMARYQLVLGQADEATHDEVAAAAEALVQALALDARRAGRRRPAVACDRIVACPADNSGRDRQRAADGALRTHDPRAGAGRSAARLPESDGPL